MKDTETVTLEHEVLKFLGHDDTKPHDHAECLESVQPLVSSLIKLFEQTVESAKPKLYRPELCYRAYIDGYRDAKRHYEQNLLQALSNSGKAGE